MKRRKITIASQARTILTPSSTTGLQQQQQQPLLRSEEKDDRNNSNNDYDNGKTKINNKPPSLSPPPAVPSPSSSSSLLLLTDTNNLGLLLLWMIPLLLIFVGLPLFVFVWYIVHHDPNNYQQKLYSMVVETELLVIVTLIMGSASIALLLHLVLSSSSSNNNSDGGVFWKYLRNLLMNTTTTTKDAAAGIPQRTKHDHTTTTPEIMEEKHNHKEEEEELWIQPRVRIWKEDEDAKAAPFSMLNEHSKRQAIAEQVLPRTLADHHWKRLYSLARDGDTFEACFQRLQDERRTLIVLQSSKGDILGGFATVAWSTKTGGVVPKDRGGSAGACVFGFRTTTTTKDDANNNANDNHRSSSSFSLDVYRWTGANPYTQLVDVERGKIAMGAAGDPTTSFESNHHHHNNYCYAWSAERNFTVGTTGRCPTFDNEPLCQNQERFDIVDLEVYGFCLVGG